MNSACTGQCVQNPINMFRNIRGSVCPTHLTVC